MLKQSLRAFAALAVLALAACNGGGNGIDLGTSSGGGLTSTIRVLNGSPDVGTVDVYLTNTSGSAVASALPYGAVSAYVAVSTQAYTVIVTTAATTTQKATCATPLLGLFRYTIVIAGRAANGTGTSTGLQCQIFPEIPQTVPSGQEELGLHHAAPGVGTSGNGTLSFGTYAPGQGGYNTPAGSATYASSLTTAAAVGTSTYTLIAGVTSGNGEGVYVAPQTASAPASVLATVLPSQAAGGGTGGPGINDSGNYLPSPSSTVFDVYAVDGASAGTVKLVGVLD